MKIVLLYKYLKYDADQLMHRYANVKKDNPDVRELADMSGSDESDENLTRRLLCTGNSHLMRVLRKFVEQDFSNADDTLQRTRTEWGYSFKQDLLDAHSMAELMHWFVIKYAMWQWCLTYAPDEAGLAKTEFDEVSNDLKRMLGEGDMPIKVRRTDGIGGDDTEIVIIYGEENF